MQLKSLQQNFRQGWIEWAFVSVLLALCLVLTLLQYRWTGEMSRAETERLRLGMTEQAQALTQAFDTELTEACSALIPSRAQLRDLGITNAVMTAHRDWRAMNPRPIFRRIAVAVPVAGGVELLAPDTTNGTAVRIEWPEEWSPLRDYVRRMLQGGPPHFDAGRGDLLEFPLFGGGPGGGGPGRELGWLLCQIDLDYVRGKWIPELMQTHMSLLGTEAYDITVLSAATEQTLFSTRNTPGKEIAFSARFQRGGRSGESAANVRHDGARGPRGPNQNGAWILQLRPRQGALETLIASNRRRNLGVAVLLNALILAAGFALVFHTRRSRQLSEAQMSFVATISHELRTPLTVIRGAGHNLSRGVVKDRDQIEAYSKLIIQHADQLKEMVEQVLTLSGAAGGRAASPKEPISLVDLLREAVTNVDEDIKAAGCEVQLSVPADLPTILGDAGALRRVFQNLITNAAKHGGEGRWIGITAAQSDRNGRPVIQVDVADRGPGIPKEEQAKIFKPFFRGARARSNQVRGSGLGLSVVREIVAAHGGHISVRSEQNKETVFTLSLPIHPPASPA